MDLKLLRVCIQQFIMCAISVDFRVQQKKSQTQNFSPFFSVVAKYYILLEPVIFYELQSTPEGFFFSAVVRTA